jgi:flagellar biosynthesis/type III secretory pathway protein FliH
VTAPQARTLMSVQNDMAALAADHIVDPDYAVLAAHLAAKARDLAEEAYELGKAEGRREGRKALGKAWSAALEMIPDEFWAELPYTDPALAARFREVVLGDD